jgi:hypothetical protein
VVSGDICVKFHLVTKSDNFEWSLVVVYGAAQDAQKGEFLAKLVCMCENDPLPMLVGGDFNIIRWQEEKTMIILMLDGRSVRMLYFKVLTQEK